MAPPDESAPTLDELVFQFLEVHDPRAPDRDAALDAFCAAWPERRAPLESALRELDELGMLGPLDDAPRARCGPFRLERRLGGGGMGQVHLARRFDASAGGEPGSPVALKLIRSDRLDEPEVRARFLREAEAARHLDHPGIARVVEVGDVDGEPYLAFEYHEGLSLEHVIAEFAPRAPQGLTGTDLAEIIDAEDGAWVGPWWRVSVQIVREVARALAHAHARGLVHRDVKPSNVLATVDGRVLLLDFGLAGWSDASRLTTSGSHLGSLPYMAPEQIRGAQLAGERSDVYSLGITLFELLTLRLPFRESDPERLALEVLRGGAPRPSTLHPGLPPGLDAVVSCATDPDAANRYASTEAFAADLTAVLDGRPPTARLPGLSRRLRRWARRRPTAAVAAGFVAFTLVAGPTAYGLVQRSHAKEVQELNEDLGRALAAETEARGAAARNLDRVIDTVVSTLERLRATEHIDSPELWRAQRDSATRALEAVRAAAEDAGDPERVQFLVGRILEMRAEAHQEIGDVEEARRDRRMRIAQLRERPASPERDGPLALLLTADAKSLFLAGDHAAALEIAEEAAYLAEDALAALPDDEDPDPRLGAVLVHVARHRIRAGDDAGAVEWLAHGTQVLEDAVAREPSNWQSRYELARALDQAAGIAQRRTDHAAAVELAERARQETDAALEVAPQDRWVREFSVRTRMSAAGSASILGESEWRRRRYDEAEEQLATLERDFPGDLAIRQMTISLANGRAELAASEGDVEGGMDQLGVVIETLYSIREERPDDMEFTSTLITALHNMANMKVYFGDGATSTLEESEELATEALEIAEETGCDLDDVLARTWYTRSIARAQLDRPDEARADLEQVALRTDDHPLYLFMRADGYCELFRALTRTDAPESEVLEARERTLSLLEAAVAAGYRDGSDLANNKVWDPLRDDPRFRAVRAEIE